MSKSEFPELGYVLDLREHPVAPDDNSLGFGRLGALCAYEISMDNDRPKIAAVTLYGEQFATHTGLFASASDYTGPHAGEIALPANDSASEISRQFVGLNWELGRNDDGELLKLTGWVGNIMSDGIDLSASREVDKASHLLLLTAAQLALRSTGADPSRLPIEASVRQVCLPYMPFYRRTPRTYAALHDEFMASVN